MGPRMATKMGFESDIGNAMGAHSSLTHSKERISFFLTQRNNKNSHYSFLIEAVEGSVNNATDFHVGASQSCRSPHALTG